MKQYKLFLTILFVFVFNTIFSQSKSVFDASYFTNDGATPPIRPGKGFDIRDVYKQTKYCFTSETSNPSKLVRQQPSQKTSINVYYTKDENEFSFLKTNGFSGKASYLNLFSLGGKKLEELSAKTSSSSERLIFVAKVDFGIFEFESDPVLIPEVKTYVDNKKFNEFVNLYGTHYISGVRKEASIWVIISKTNSQSESSNSNENELNGGMNNFNGGSGSFEVTQNEKTNKFLNSENLSVSIEINGPTLSKINIEKNIKSIINGNSSDKMSAISEMIGNSMKDISNPEQSTISQYYFTPFTLYGVNNIIWNLKKENQLVKINENVIKLYSQKKEIDDLISSDGFNNMYKEIEKIIVITENDNLKNELQKTYNSILPNLKLQEKTIDLTLKDLEKAYNTCSDIQCNPDINCCSFDVLENKVQNIIEKVNTETDKLSNVIYNFLLAKTVKLNEKTAKYMCPMKCEDGFSNTKGKCPKCGMDEIENPKFGK
jgi:predicted Zn-ribbon and HTH transcriptional regulator